MCSILQHLSSEISAGKRLRKLALRWYSRAPVHVTTMWCITVGDVLETSEEVEECDDEEASEGVEVADDTGNPPVHVIRVYNHKTGGAFGPAEIPVFIQEM